MVLNGLGIKSTEADDYIFFFTIFDGRPSHRTGLGQKKKKATSSTLCAGAESEVKGFPVSGTRASTCSPNKQR